MLQFTHLILKLIIEKRFIKDKQAKGYLNHLFIKLTVFQCLNSTSVNFQYSYIIVQSNILWSKCAGSNIFLRL
jgi:hypothetical protein